MSATEAIAGTTRVNRARFLSLLFERLQYRWLSDPEIVSDAIAELFAGEETQRERLVSDLVIRNRSEGCILPSSLRRLLHKHPVIRAMFKGRKTIDLPSQVVVAGSIQTPFDWSMPAIASEGALADWLSLTSPAVLDWLTLPHRRQTTSVDHYDRQSFRKRDGSRRWIEHPRPVLKHVQRELQSRLIDAIPLHPAAHGFRKQRNVATCAAPHVGQAVVLRMDLQNFFGSIRTWRVRSLLRVAGYPPAVATTIARLCTAAPLCQSDDDLLRRSRLPQGAPTSPGLANATAFRLDRRLSALCDSLNVRYTRYADDLIFSGDDSFARRSERFATSVAAITMDEGFAVNFRKTRTMRRGNRQQILGLIVNEKIQTPRRDYETLKAILRNCMTNGPQSQNRDGHANFRDSIRGRIAHVACHHRRRGERLWKMFEQIRWG